MLIRCSRCGRDAPGDSTACPYCGDAPPPRRRLPRPIVYGAIAAAVEMAALFALIRC